MTSNEQNSSDIKEPDVKELFQENTTDFQNVYLKNIMAKREETERRLREIDA